MRRRLNKEEDLGKVSESTGSVEPQIKSPMRRFHSVCNCLNIGIFFTVVLLLFWIIGRDRVSSYVAEERTLLLGYGKARETSIPEYLMDIFCIYDANNDGHLDPEEFKLLTEYIPNRKEFFSTWSPPSDNKTDEPVFEPFVFQDKHREEGSEVVVVKTDFEPMLISSMKTVKESMAIFGRMESIFPGLYQWIEAAKPTAKYGVGNFRAFAPPSEGWAVGVPYYVVSNKSNPAMEHPPLQMPPHRYHPPLPEGREVLMHALLSQFHPNVFLGMRFEPRGTLAVIRAVNEHYYDIAIRSHAEYQLNSKPDLPFWFTPAQFNGRLVISKDFKHLLSFKLWVPTNKQLNIDMEWLTKPDGETNQVDIGYIPKMELFSDGPSKLETTSSVVEEDKPVWIEEISLAEADSILEQAFFPFKQVPYLPFAEAFDLASEQQKPVHHILLWGALDDQSC